LEDREHNFTHGQSPFRPQSIGNAVVEIGTLPRRGGIAAGFGVAFECQAAIEAANDDLGGATLDAVLLVLAGLDLAFNGNLAPLEDMLGDQIDGRLIVADDLVPLGRLALLAGGAVAPAIRRGEREGSYAIAAVGNDADIGCAADASEQDGAINGHNGLLKRASA